MIWNEIISELKAQRLAGMRFEKAGHTKYRDRITVYTDAKILFERFCYGEAAGLVFELWGTAAEPIAWQYDKCAHSQKQEAPKVINAYVQGQISFDDKPNVWECREYLKSDAKHGYSRLRVLLARK